MRDTKVHVLDELSRLRVLRRLRWPPQAPDVWWEDPAMHALSHR